MEARLSKKDVRKDKIKQIYTADVEEVKITTHLGHTYYISEGEDGELKLSYPNKHKVTCDIRHDEFTFGEKMNHIFLTQQL